MKGSWPLLVIAALFGGAGIVLVYIWGTLPEATGRLLGIAVGSFVIAGAAIRSVREHVREEERRRPAEARVVRNEPRAHAQPAPAAPPKSELQQHAPIVVERAPQPRNDTPIRDGNPGDEPKLLR